MVAEIKINAEKLNDDITIFLLSDGRYGLAGSISVYCVCACQGRGFDVEGNCRSGLGLQKCEELAWQLRIMYLEFQPRVRKIRT